MNLLHSRPLLVAISLSLLMLSGCDKSSSSTTETDSTNDTTDTTDDSSTDTDSGTTVTGAININNFVSGALASSPIVDCTLSDGTETTCYEITTVGKPAGQTPGPFCPSTIYDNDADSSGMWFHESGTDGIVELTGNFIQDLPAYYGATYPGNTWILYDADGNVNVTDTQEACEAAARPDVDVAYQNHCVECSMDYLDGGVQSATYMIPTTPIAAATTGNVSQVGIALNGTELSASAPVNDILSNFTIAAFDDCGGHINTNQGYHYHAATDCAAVGTQDDGHAALMGYALDGYGIYAMRDSNGAEETGLDECRGQTDDVRGYHYHAASPGENIFIGCFRGLTVASTNAGGPPGGGPPGGPQ